MVVVADPTQAGLVRSARGGHRPPGEAGGHHARGARGRHRRGVRQRPRRCPTPSASSRPAPPSARPRRARGQRGRRDGARRPGGLDAPHPGASATGASDVHIEPMGDRVRIRNRVDGALHEVLSLPQSMAQALVSRIKIMADMNIVERRRPQDGQIETDGRRDQPRHPGQHHRRRSTARRPCCGSSTRRRALYDVATLGMADGHGGGVPGPHPVAVRHGRVRRAHRVGQDHHAVRHA